MTRDSSDRWFRGPLALASRAIVLLGAIGALGCSTTPEPPPAPAFESYRVGAPDSLVVTILPEPVIQEAVIVRPDGMITIQLVGDVPAGGRTPQEIAADVEERIARFKRGARVTVAVTAAQSHAVTVLGEVAAPGAFPITKLTRVAEAIGNRGGLTHFASAGKVRIVRHREGNVIVLPVNLKGIKAGDLSSNVQVYAGDIIYIPPTLWARFGYAINQLLFPFSPFLGLATSAAGSALVR